MKASLMILHLRELMKKYGDIDVDLPGGAPLTKIEVIEPNGAVNLRELRAREEKVERAL